MEAELGVERGEERDEGGARGRFEDDLPREARGCTFVETGGGGRDENFGRGGGGEFCDGTRDGADFFKGGGFGFVGDGEFGKIGEGREKLVTAFFYHVRVKIGVVGGEGVFDEG